MKKITLALAMMLAIGLVAATAQEANIGGSASLEIGYDLANGGFGMVTSSADLSIDLDLVPESDAETEAADGWYGWVKLTDFEISFDDDDALTANAPGIEAKIINGPMYFVIYALDGKSVGQAAEVEDDEDDDYDVEDDETSLGTDLSDGSGGFTFGYTTDMFTVEAHLATETGYDDTDAADNAHFLVGADVDVAAGPADITLEVVRGIGVEETLGLGVGADLEIDPITLGVGFDGELPDGGTFDWEIGASADVAADPLTVALDFVYGDTTDMDIEADVDLDVDPLTVGLFAGFYDSFADYRIYVDTSFAATDEITIMVEGGYDSLTQIPIKVAVEAKLIPNTTFTLQYDTDDVQTDTGDVFFKTKVAY
jgi:hypothetical protein